MLTIRPATKQDFHGLHLNATQALEQEILNAIPEDSLEENAIAFEKRNQTIAFAGFHQFWPGRVFAWLLVTDAMQVYDWICAVRGARRLLANLQKKDPVLYRRIETTCAVSDLNAQRWLEMIGFEKEGLMRSYMIDGQDHYLYARIA